MLLYVFQVEVDDHSKEFFLMICLKYLKSKTQIVDRISSITPFFICAYIRYTSSIIQFGKTLTALIYFVAVAVDILRSL